MEICETDKHAIDNTCMTLFEMLHISDIYGQIEIQSLESR